MRYLRLSRTLHFIWLVTSTNPDFENEDRKTSLQLRNR